MKKTLIINGSPHKTGSTSHIVNMLKNKLVGDIEEVYAYFEKISPCIDCRYCWQENGCAIKDTMDKIYKDDYDTIVISSPIYFSNLTPPMLSILSRLNMIWSNKHFAGIEHNLKEKRGILVLAGGGNGNPTYALKSAQMIFNLLNAKFDINKDYIYSLNTDTLPVSKDSNLKKLIENL